MNDPLDGCSCSRCAYPLRYCLCPVIPRIETRLRIVIVRHSSERKRTSNSARAVGLALCNCEILDHGKPGAPLIEPAALNSPGTWLLFPEGKVYEPTNHSLPQRLLVLDGSWSQAKHMRQRLPGLRGLPVLRLPQIPTPASRLRKVPGPGYLSTIEAVAAALRLLQEEDAAQSLDGLFAELVERRRRAGRLHCDRVFV